jgi:hypothetical protein
MLLGITSFIIWAALGLSLAALWSLYSSNNWLQSVPLLIFYITLIINTLFSIKFFSLFPRRKLSSYAIDVILVGIYVAMALSIARAALFCYLASWLFLIAAIRYCLLLESTENNSARRRKIIIDLLGAALSLFAFGGVVLGHSLIATWVFATTFVCANVHLLLSKPMYRQ